MVDCGLEVCEIVLAASGAVEDVLTVCLTVCVKVEAAEGTEGEAVGEAVEEAVGEGSRAVAEGGTMVVLARVMPDVVAESEVT